VVANPKKRNDNVFRVALVILDGFGLRGEREGNAFALADTPVLDQLMAESPMISLVTSGELVGLPEGVMGNSEVGHLNIGAGRVVRQDLVRINEAVQSGTFHKHPVLREQIRKVKSDPESTFHVIGLCSDDGVHSHLDHLKAILDTARDEGLSRILFHAVMDGRDTSPSSGKRYLVGVQKWLDEMGCGAIATVVGRYYLMDRDKRWDRNEKAYRMLVHGEGEAFPTVADAIDASYAQKTGDEFVTPKIIGEGGAVRSGDSILMMNFRADRMRQIVRSFIEPDFTEFPVEALDVDVRTMTMYDETFGIPVLFPPEVMTNLFPEVLAQAGYRQLRLAETEKYAHVTYFFNGGEEQTFPGEERMLVSSPRVATYDLKPSMSAVEVTDKAVEAIESGKVDVLICNYANPDMVGHTGIMEAATEAMETIDVCIGRLREAVEGQGGALFLTSDHGNIETMLDTDGSPHTAHTTRQVPLVMIVPDDNMSLEGDGKLADIAPTILTYLGIEIPSEMTGVNHLIRR
jgi:2,3-bisphosphoglycerate-independent phosphoglycerate mutase